MVFSNILTEEQLQAVHLLREITLLAAHNLLLSLRHLTTMDSFLMVAPRFHLRLQVPRLVHKVFTTKLHLLAGAGL